jgi:hypothetical protein
MPTKPLFARSSCGGVSVTHERVRPVAAVDRRSSVVDGDVDDAHVDGRLARELVAEILRTEQAARGRTERSRTVPSVLQKATGVVAAGITAPGAHCVCGGAPRRPGADEGRRPKSTTSKA